MRQGHQVGTHCELTAVTRRPGAARRDAPPAPLVGLILLATIAGWTGLVSTDLAAATAADDGDEGPAAAQISTGDSSATTDDPGQEEIAGDPQTGDPRGGPKEKLTRAVRFERAPGVLGTSIRTLRKEMVKGYANESLGYLALDLEDMRLSPVERDGRLSLNLGDKLQFKSRSDKVSKKAEPILDGIARLLLENPGNLIQVIAHTDDRGDGGYNLRLSQRRADSVKAYLMDRSIEEVRIIAIGRGEEEPLASLSGSKPTRSSRAKNRRVELLIEPMELPNSVRPPVTELSDGGDEGTPADRR